MNEDCDEISECVKGQCECNEKGEQELPSNFSSNVRIYLVKMFTTFRFHCSYNSRRIGQRHTVISVISGFHLKSIKSATFPITIIFP